MPTYTLFANENESMQVLTTTLFLMPDDRMSAELIGVFCVLGSERAGIRQIERNTTVFLVATRARMDRNNPMDGLDSRSQSCFPYDKLPCSLRLYN